MANQRLNIDIVARDKSKQALTGVQKSLSRLKGSIFNLRNAFIGLGAGIVLKGIISAGMQIEELGVQLEALFGSAKKGKQALDAVTKFAKTTPFELSNIQQGVTALATVAEKAESLGISFEELLKITGNTAVQLGGDFALASQQIQRSFSAGIGSADLFRDRAVTAMAGFEAGVKVSVDESIKGLQKAFGTGGKFGELTNKLANTLKGTISNLKDALFTIQTEVASGFFDELKEQLGSLKKLTEQNDVAIRRFSKNMGENLAKAMLKVVQIGKDLIPTLQKIGRILKSIADGFLALPPFVQEMGVVGAFLFGKKGLAALVGISLFMDKIEEFQKRSEVKKGIFDTSNLDDVNIKIDLISKKINDLELQNVMLGGVPNPALDEELKNLRAELEMYEQIQKKLKTLNNIRKLGAFEHQKELHKGLKTQEEINKEFEKRMENTARENGLIRNQNQEIETIMSKLETLNETALENIRNKFSDIKTTIAEGINGGITKFSNSLARAIILGEDLGKSFKKMVADALVNTLALLIEVVIRMGIQKLLGIELEKGENKRLNIARKYTQELKIQVALAAMLAVLTGGSSMSFGGFGKRASGGSVQKDQPYMVGENGPEMFIPNSSGQITQSARGGGNNGAVNVNFHINAVNAAGIDQLLIERRGTISRIINESVNERGRGAII